MKLVIFPLLILFAILFATVGSLPAQMAVVDSAVSGILVSNWAKQLAQGADQLKQVTEQVQAAKSQLQTAQSALQYQGNPAAVLGGIKDAALGGSLSPSSVGTTFDKLLDTLHGAGNISSQLQGLVGAPISIENIKSQLLAGQTPSGSSGGVGGIGGIAKYQAMEKLFDQQSQQLQVAAKQSAQLRAQLVDLRSQVATAPDQATTEKLTAAISSTSAALATTDSTINQLHGQMQMSAQMVQNRKMMEDAAYQEAYRQVSEQQSKDDAARMQQAFQNLNQTR